jgi:cysteinyl-tRNA synthetase
MNITDVGHLTDDGDQGEDKMEKGARQQGITARDVAEKFTNIYVEDLKLLKIDDFDVMPRATDHIAEQIAMVQELEEK